MSGIAKAVKKVFKKIKPLIKVAVIAVALYYTAGAAAGAFSAPAAGAATATGATTMAGATATATGGAMLSSAAPVGGMAGATAASQAATAAAAAAGAAAPVGGMAGATAGQAAAGTAAQAAAPAAASQASGGMLSWLKDNPMATMMLGQGLAGAATASAEEDIADRAEKARKDRGLMGFDYEGRSAYGDSGIVKNAMPQDPGNIATQAPTVAPQQVAPQQTPGQQVAARTTPVPREKLPEMKKSGQIV